MRAIHAMGVTTELFEQLDLVLLLRQHLGTETKIEVIDDLENHFGVNSKEYCWTFGVDCGDKIDQWIDVMKQDGYVFEGSTLLVDNFGYVSGIWANAEAVAVSTEEEDDSEEEDEEDEGGAQAVSEAEIQAHVMLKCIDEEGKIERMKIRGTYKRRRQEDYLCLVDVIDIDKDNGIKKEDVEALLEWVNECNVSLMDFTIEGPAYIATQAHVHNFGIKRICLDQLHAIVLDRMISTLREHRSHIQTPQSPTEMKMDGK